LQNALGGSAITPPPQKLNPQGLLGAPHNEDVGGVCGAVGAGVDAAAAGVEAAGVGVGLAVVAVGWVVTESAAAVGDTIGAAAGWADRCEAVGVAELVRDGP